MLRSFQRSYENDVLVPARAAQVPIEIESLGTVRYAQGSYELLALSAPRRGPDDTRPRLLVSGGVHGNEPAGTLAAVRFATDLGLRAIPCVRWSVIVCVNPSGYELVQRANYDNIDVNRSFKGGSYCQEALLIQAWLEAQKTDPFRAAIDLHECFPSNDWLPAFQPADFPLGYFLWEMCESKKRRVGPAIIKAVSAVVPICTWPKMIGDLAVDGVISYPEHAASAEYANGTSFDAYLFSRHCDHTFTFESPGIFPLETRVRAHLTALEATILALTDKG